MICEIVICITYFEQVMCLTITTIKKHFTYRRVCNYINTTGATSGAGTAGPSGESRVCSGVRVTRS